MADEQMRILHVTTRFQRGGAERNMLNTVLWERRAGHDVHLAAGRDCRVEDVPPDVPLHIIPTLVRSVSAWSDIRALRELRGLISGEEFDVVHTHESKAGILGRVAARGVARSIVHTVHMASFGPAYGRLGSFVFLRAERYCASFTDVIVTVGDELRRMYIEADVGQADAYLVARSPIDIAAFADTRALDAAARAAARCHFGLAQEDRLVVTVAVLEPRKRVDVVMRELAPLLRTGGTSLAVAGEGPAREALSELAASLGVADRVRLLGHVGDVPLLLAGADVLVHAATMEGVPQVVVQALAAGVPAVATEMTGLREVPGAPVVVVPASGSGLGEAVSRVLGAPPPPVPLADLEPWTMPHVERALEAVHRRILLRRASASAPPVAT